MKKILVILLVACVVLPQLAFAGAWTLPKNHIWGEYAIKWDWTNKYFDGHCALKRPAVNPRTWGWSMSPKIEYGLTDWLTLMSGLEYKESTYKEYSRPATWGTYVRKNHGLTEVTVGARARLIKKPVVTSIQVKGFINTLRGYDLNREPGISDRCDSIELRGLAGKKWDAKWPFYLAGESGYRWRNRDVCNDIPFFIETGFWPTKWLLIKTEIDGYWSHNNTGDLNKDYAIWRIGPVFQLFNIWKKPQKSGGPGGPGGPPSGPPESDDFITNTITRKGTAFDVAVQYGNTFWGRNTNGAQEVVLKVSAQF